MASTIHRVESFKNVRWRLWEKLL